MIDGNDVVAVQQAVAAAAARARAGDGPTVIEALTYRQYGHSRSDPGKYRPQEEVDAWLKRDPLLVLAERLRDRGVDQAEVDRLDARAREEVAAAVEAAKRPRPVRGHRLHRRVGGRRCPMADLITYREAVAAGIAQEMRRDPTVVCLGEDIGAAEGVFKTATGLFAEFGPERVWDTPISEQAIVGAAMGAAMTGMRPVAEIMFSDFLACCWDYVANEIPKVRYMTGGQVSVPLVIRTANGSGLGFGAQHSQPVENWAFAVPGLKIAAPSTPADMVGLMAAAIRSDDPVLVFEHKALLATKGDPRPPATTWSSSAGPRSAARAPTSPWSPWPRPCPPPWPRPSSWPPTASTPRSSTCAAWSPWTPAASWTRWPAPAAW